METARGYRVELDLNNEQITACKKHCGAARFAYNWALHRKQEDYKAGKKTPYATDLHRELNALKQSDFPWMRPSSTSSARKSSRRKASGVASVAIPSSRAKSVVWAVAPLPDKSMSILMRSSCHA